jgi:hypothetical protein
MHRILVILITLGLCLGFSNPARGEQEIQFSTPQVAYRFGEQLTIETDYQSEDAIETVEVILQPGTGVAFSAGEIDIDGNQITFTLDLSQNPLPAFATIEYWYQGALRDGSTFTSKRFEFRYRDDRFEWQSLSTEQFEIHWYGRDKEFGERVLKAAEEGIEHLETMIAVPKPKGITFYVYANSQELQSALLSASRSSAWIAGHADPALGHSLVSIAANTSQVLEIKRQIPHELTHLLLYQKLDEGYANLPRWLNEGLATVAELSPNPNYPVLLKRGYERGVLMSFETLCDSFPNDAANFQLAYAQSASFTRYLQTEFGQEGIEDLLRAYQQGVSCQEGSVIALGKLLPQLEREWRQVQFGESALLLGMQNLGPWLLILALVLVSTLSLAFVGNKEQSTDH